MKHLRLPLIVVLTLCIACTLVVGLNAQWIYPDLSLSLGDSNGANITLQEFEYTPDEVLPGGDQNDQEVEVGQNHNSLIDRIVNHVTYGLNATKKPIVKDLLLEDGLKAVYSNQTVSGGNLKHILIDDASMEALDFAVKYETDTFLTAYTFASKYLTSSQVGQTIEVYKTDIVLENGTWVAKRSYKGTAVVSRVFVQNKQIVNIDVFGWKDNSSTTN
ncbi:MAG: hypothetical protein IJD18_00130 [Clostridia bacterium]|nr:hypothetical protein [Clostridia bacterium]